VDWFGKATVLALSGKVLAACGAGGVTPDVGTLPPDAGRDGGDGSLDGGHRDGDARLDGGDGSPDAGDGGSGEGFAFAEGSGAHPVYDEWPVRTVDRQQIEEILSSWRLTIDGLVERPTTLTFGELIALPRLDLTMDFHCVEGWSVLDVPWNSVHLSTLLEQVGGALPEATHVNFHTRGGTYNESLPLEVALEPHSMLGYGVGGSTLPLDHGFPLRVHVPRLLAYKSAKYVERVELSTRPLLGYWVRAGYPYDGEVPESRLREGRY
jgi:DMSO/TMAO reductase YedYZ molybdopterin-dependent catalytic subunit